jgi:DNA processing protein
MHRALAREIASGGGLLVSQFEPEAKPFPANFLNRNRVIAGLSLGVLVVEAAARSGALVTARCALDSGRELLVVPGGIRDPLFEGSHKLLRDGAVPITACADLFESFPVSLPPVGEPRSSAPLTPGQLKVREFLRSGAPVSVTELFRTVGGEIHTEILALELCGAVVRLPGDLIQWVGEGS